MKRSDGTSPIGKEHVVEQNAGIRLVDPERALHRFRRQTDLVASDGAAFGKFDLDPRLLDGIGVLNGDSGVIQRYLPDLLLRLLRPMQPFGGKADIVFAQGHAYPVTSAE
jgi:hypothetical protein